MDTQTLSGTFLANRITISDYQTMENEKDKEKISAFIKARFIERYITPLRCDLNLKHGFCTMAICCLMIETLESFWQGWDNTNHKGKSVFISFFKRNENLGIFSSYAEDFYKNVRCGILHQAETKNGWRLRRDGPLFNSETKTINATKFHNEMEFCINFYCSTLEQSSWESEVWIKFRSKMKAIISNCGVQA